MKSAKMPLLVSILALGGAVCRRLRRSEMTVTGQSLFPQKRGPEQESRITHLVIAPRNRDTEIGLNQLIHNSSQAYAIRARRLIAAIALSCVTTCSAPETVRAESVEVFLARHTEYDAGLIPEHCKITTMEGAESRILIRQIEENRFFRGAPITKFRIHDFEWEFRYLIIKRKGAHWPENGSRVAIVLFDGLVDCGGNTAFNGVIFIK